MINRTPDTLYFVKPKGLEGPYKVGITSDLKRRVRHISNASPFPMELVCSMKGDRKLEGRIHAALLHAHTHCEWFNDCPEIRCFVAEIKSGTFCADSLPPAKGVSSFINGKPRPLEQAA